MASPKIENCRSCRAEIIWALTENGKRIPLDRKREKRFVLWDHPDGDFRAVMTEVYVPHFATCPQAGEWRRK